MPVADLLRPLVATGVMAVVPLVPPSQLVIDDIPGFERTSEPATDLDFDQFAEIEPDSVAHIDPDSEEPAGLTAAIEIWSDAAADETIVVEVVLAIDDEAAATFVDQAAANSIAAGLAAVDPPFGGAWSYSGDVEERWTNIVAWTQGPYAVILNQRSPVEIDRARLDAAAVRQVEIILDATGNEVSDQVVVDDQAPTPPTEAPAPDEEESSFPFGALLVVVAVVGVGVGVVLQQRRRHSGTR